MKKSFKTIILVVLGIIISITCTVVAETIIESKNVTYSNTVSGGSYADVQDAIDELYARARYVGEKYTEEILHGADPVLSGELIPVYLAENGDVYYANTHTSWYSYEYKRWANAVILVDDAYAKNRQDNKDKYSVGDKIDEQDIESYFVWIPRYAYKLWDLESQNDMIDASTLTNKDYASSPSNLNNTRIIDVEFGIKNYLDEKGYKSLTRNSGTGEFTEPVGLAINEYLEHPAFTLGTEELNGFWIGKFETGYNQTNAGESAITGTNKWTTANAAQVDSIVSNKIVVKPNIYSWRNIKVGDIFNVSKGYNTELKSHMLKNTEWGAVVYLSHSAYGKGADININNTSDYKTGYSANPNTDQTSHFGENGLSTSGLSDKYNTSVGYLASTTGNITGVYDMAGGSWEYVAATMISNRNTDSTSGFSADTVIEQMKSGYIDAYPADSTIASYNKRILGDATGELAPFYQYYEANGTQHWHSAWYGDLSCFVDADYPWFYRGGVYDYGVLGGAFYFTRNTGSGFENHTFRLALAP